MADRLASVVELAIAQNRQIPSVQRLGRPFCLLALFLETEISMIRYVMNTATIVAILIFASSSARSDWTRFRGPNGSGVDSSGGPTPTTWSDAENLRWKVAMPGRGSSSPIVVGDRVFVTCWSGYGMDQSDPGDQKQLRRHLLCIDGNTGKTLWSKAVEPYLPEDEFRGMFTQHGYASHTPVSDGQRVYAFFGKTGALAFDMEGNQLWQTSVGTESGSHDWGTASSPILHKNLLIVTATAESEALVALDKATGKTVWRQEAAGFNSTWGTPVLAKVDADRTDLVIAVPYEIWGLDPDTGKLRWYCEAIGVSSFCSSVVAHDGIVYAMESGRDGSGGIAVRVGGKGDVTGTHVVWSGSQSNRIGTPVLHEGRLYSCSNKIVNCYDAATGKELYKSRLTSSGSGVAEKSDEPEQREDRGGLGGDRGRGRRGGGMGGQDYASLVFADGKHYFLSRSGDIFVLKTGDSFEQLAVNHLGDTGEDFSATPALSNGCLFIRSSKHLYCVASQEGE
jgi:outer membrane protein assembly factor BamB